MPDLYIANCTKQDYKFTFRIPERKGHEMLDIRAGAQTKLRGLSPAAIDAIKEHYEPYGMRHVREVKRTKDFVGLIYSDEPIDYDGISEAVEHNTEVLEDTGKKLRAAAAVAVDQSLINSGPSSSELKATNIEVVEFEHKDRPDTKINEKITVKPGEGDKNLRRRGAVDMDKRK